MTNYSAICLLFSLISSYCSGLQPPLPRKADSSARSAVLPPSGYEAPLNRRAMFQSVGIASAVLFGAGIQSNALDMDAFMNAEVSLARGYPISTN